MSLDNYDKDKFVVLVCAGPSARFVKKTDEYYTAGVNVTPNLIEETDFWVVNDGCYLVDLSDEKLLKINNIALPQFPHTVNGVDYRPTVGLDYLAITKYLPSNIKIHPFNIHTAPKFNMPYNTDLPYFDVRSSSESCFKWLLHKGFTKFISLGHDPSGGYHSSQYSRPTKEGGRVMITAPIDNPRYHIVHQRMRSVIKEAGASWIRAVLPPDSSFDEEMFNKIKDHTLDETGYAEVTL